MRFLHPELATWLLVVPIAVAWWTFRRYRRLSVTHQLGLGDRGRAWSRLTTTRTDFAGLVLALVALIALVVAVMQPQLIREWRLPEYERRDLLIVLDRSVSMRATDVPPTRFARAVQEIKHFLEQKPPEIDRVALVGFSNAAVAISHFTRSANSLFFYLDWLADDSRPNFGTDIGSALLTAEDVINRDATQTPKVVLVISDGEDEGDVLESAVRRLRTAGVSIYAVGIGGPNPIQVPVPADDGEGEAGWTLQVRFQESTLRSIATSGGGRYYRSQTGHELLDAMQDLAMRERRQVGWTTRTEYRDMHPFALGLAALAAGALLITL
jgi:Ca-activated chloride channel family protein